MRIVRAKKAIAKEESARRKSQREGKARSKEVPARRKCPRVKEEGKIGEREAGRVAWVGRGQAL